MKRSLRISVLSPLLPLLRVFSTQNKVRPSNLKQIYELQVEKGRYQSDPKQLRIIKYLDRIKTILEYNEGSMTTSSHSNNSLDVGIPNLSNSLVNTNHINIVDDINVEVKKEQEEQEIKALPVILNRPRLRGAYIYGNVGTGKTMLMDLFYQNCSIKQKQRVHFHQFMLNIHKQIHIHKQSLLQKYGRDIHVNLSSERDAIIQVAQELSQSTRLLCIDEFQVTDICDAMILLKFFSVLWKNDTIIVVTSNRPPSDLYQDGLNRQYFLPFIDRIQQECVVKNIDSDYDYRSNMAFSNENNQNHSTTCTSITYFCPISEQSTVKLQELFQNDLILLSDHTWNISRDEANSVGEVTVPIMMGRSWKIAKGCLDRRITWLEYDDVCKSDRGAADYKALCLCFDVIYLHNIPILNILQHDTARRFITFIDEVYDNKIRLLWTAMKPPSQMFQELQAIESIESKEQTKSPTSFIRPETIEEHKYFRGDNTTTHVVRRKLFYVSHPNVFYVPSINRLLLLFSFLLIFSKCLNIFIEAFKNDAAQEEESEFLQGELASVKELGFAFRRAASRLNEMSGSQYYQDWLVSKGRL